MKTLIFACVVTMLLALPGFAAQGDDESGHHFGPWLASDPLQGWLKENMAGRQLYVSAVEGRLHNGITEWRVEASPLLNGVVWYWYLGMDSDFYNARVNDFVTKQHFKQLWVQSFLDAKGQPSYQAVFVKI